MISNYLLQESYIILSSEEERRIYDWSLARAENTDKFIWPFEVDITQTKIPEEDPPQLVPLLPILYLLVVIKIKINMLIYKCHHNSHGRTLRMLDQRDWLGISRWDG